MHFSMLFAICACAGGLRETSAQILKKDDLTFRKKTFADKRGHKMPYRLFVPANYDASQKYPLIFWLHGAAGRGSDKLKQNLGGKQERTQRWTKTADKQKRA